MHFAMNTCYPTVNFEVAFNGKQVSPSLISINIEALEQDKQDSYNSMRQDNLSFIVQQLAKYEHVMLIILTAKEAIQLLVLLDINVMAGIVTKMLNFFDKEALMLLEVQYMQVYQVRVVRICILYLM